MNVIAQIAGLCGAALILVAYIGHQTRRMDAGRIPYNALNMVGSAILAYLALQPLQLGFVVLEGVWAIVSLAALVRAVRAIPS